MFMTVETHSWSRLEWIRLTIAVGLIPAGGCARTARGSAAYEGGSSVGVSSNAK